MMRPIKQYLKGIPGLAPLYRKLRAIREKHQLRRMTTEQVFTAIVRANRWGGAASVSGTGSDLAQTRVIARELPVLLRELAAKTLLDIPCGDFHWMQSVDLRGITYTGADIVAELPERNQSVYGDDTRHFVRLNLLTDSLPCADVVLCRDCLVHFSFADIRLAIDSIRASGSRYLLTTTFPARSTNWDIVTGQWRPLNIEAPPISLPRPLRLVNEECPDEDGAYSDKSLGLWRLAELQ
jgi:hypothetical protein